LHTPQGCPSWMSDYSAFHARQRGQPGARYAASLCAVQRA
jgi:hypothetical protein